MLFILVTSVLAPNIRASIAASLLNFLILVQAQADAMVRRTGDTASLIQACIRSHLLRKELRDKANKKGKKGGGKKK